MDLKLPKIDLSSMKKKAAATAPRKSREERRQDMLRKKKEKKDNEKITLYDLRYDQEHDEYILTETTEVKRADLPRAAVHVTGKKKKYLHTDLWDDLIWPGTGPSAIHMYLWVINEKINPDTILEKKSKITEVDWKKIAMYGAIVIVILFLAPKFIH
jgi:hypothetical protein